MDSPERTATLLLICRCRKMGWLSAVDEELSAVSVTVWSICMVTRLPAFTEGVTARFTPVSRYWMVLVTALLLLM